MLWRNIMYTWLKLNYYHYMTQYIQKIGDLIYRACVQLSLEFFLFALMYKKILRFVVLFLHVSLDIWLTFWTSLPESLTAAPLQTLWPGRPISEQTLILTGDVAGLGHHRHLSHTGQTVVYRTHWAIIQQAGHI